MIDPVPTQGMVVNLEFPRGCLDRRASCEKALDPHAFEMITPLASPCSRTLLLRHVRPLPRNLVFLRKLAGNVKSHQPTLYDIMQNCGAVMAVSDLDLSFLETYYRT